MSSRQHPISITRRSKTLHLVVALRSSTQWGTSDHIASCKWPNKSKCEINQGYFYNYQAVLVVYKHSSNRIWGGAVRWCRKWSCAHARPKLHHRELHHRKWRHWKASDRKWHHFPAFLSGTPLDSRYEQWNCQSNLYRVTIDLLLLMLNHFLNQWFITALTGTPVSIDNEVFQTE